MEPTTLRLKSVDTDTDLGAEVELQPGHILKLVGREHNERDADLAPRGDVLFVGTGAAELLTTFWENYNKPVGKIKEFCIGGASGTGKSCGAQILAADVVRRLPDACVFYYRGYDSSDSRDIHGSAKRTAAAGRQTFLFVDQLTKNEDAVNLGPLADRINLWVIMVASANIPHFREISQGRQHDKHWMVFPFSSSSMDCVQLARLLQPANDCVQSVDFAPAERLAFDAALVPLPAQPSLADMCRWTNGHLVSLARLLTGRTHAERMVSEETILMSTFCGDHVSFYVEVVKMFKNQRTFVPARELRVAGGMDLRYVGDDGSVLSPFLLQAFERSLLLGPTPADFYGASYSDLLKRNPAEIGFAVERECLQDEKLLKAGAACLERLGADLSTVPQPARIGYRRQQQIVEEATAAHAVAAGGGSWGIHAIPLAWNQRHVDGIQMYFTGGVLFVLGVQITLQTAQDHAASLAWVEELALLREGLVALPGVDNVRFVLLFVAKQTDNSVTLRVTPKRLESIKRCSNFGIFDFPIVELMTTTSAHFFQLDTSMRSYGARQLSAVPRRARKKKGSVRVPTSVSTNSGSGGVVNSGSADKPPPMKTKARTKGRAAKKSKFETGKPKKKKK